jgi:hypothetical protein
MKISVDNLKEMIREAVKGKLNEDLSLQYSDLLPGVGGELQEYVLEVDNFLKETAKKANELALKADEMMRADILNHPKVGERNRILLVRSGALRKLRINAVTILEALRREG